MGNTSRVLRRVVIDGVRNTRVESGDLKALDLFSSFSRKQLQAIAGIAERRACRTDTFIYRQGQPASEILLVEKGLVSLRANKADGNMVISFELCEAGDLFGAASLLRGQCYTLDALCLQETDVLAMNAEKLSVLCEDDYELGYRLMKRIAQLYLDRYEISQRELGIPVAVGKETLY